MQGRNPEGMWVDPTARVRGAPRSPCCLGETRYAGEGAKVSRLGPASGSPLQRLWPGKGAQLLDGGHSGASGGSTGEMGPQWSGSLRPGASPAPPSGAALEAGDAAESPDRRGYRQEGLTWAGPWNLGFLPPPKVAQGQENSAVWCHRVHRARGPGQTLPSLQMRHPGLGGASLLLQAGGCRPRHSQSHSPWTLPRAGWG